MPGMHRHPLERVCPECTRQKRQLSPPRAQWGPDDAGQSVGMRHAYGANVLGVRPSRQGRTPRDEPLASSCLLGATTSSSSSLKRWWMRNTRNGALQATVLGTASLPGGGRSSSLPAFLSARPRLFSPATSAFFLSCSIFVSSCVPVF